MALHENFIEYTPEEILAIKRDICVKNKCPYLGAAWSNPNKKKGTIDYASKCCNYILYKGESRNCMPDECTHYNDKNVNKKNSNDNIYIE